MASVARCEVRSTLAPLLLAASLACAETEYDRGHVCVAVETLEDGRLQLLGTADSNDCAADHRGASFECAISLDGALAHIDTEYRPGRDPDHACAGPIITTCTAELPNPGTYTLEFAGKRDTITAPSDETVCLPYSYPYPDETGESG